MQLDHKEQLLVIGVPTSGKLVHTGNQIILAKLDLRGAETETDERDFTIQSGPDWFQRSMLKPLFYGRQDEYRITSAMVCKTQIVLEVKNRSAEPAVCFELVLVPSSTSEVRFMLALYLAEVFDCLAEITLYWGPNALSRRSELEVVSQDLDHRIDVVRDPNEPPFKEVVKKVIEAAKPVEPVATPQSQPKTAKPTKPATPAATAAKPVAKTEKQVAPLTTGDEYTQVVRALESKGWVANGKAKKSKCSLMECAEYVMIVNSVVQDRLRFGRCIDYLNKELGLPDRETLQEYLGDSSTEWIQNAKEWLK